MNKRFRALFFDVGHTLLRAHPSVGELYAAEAARQGATVAPARFEEELSSVFREFVPRFYADPSNRITSDEKDEALWRELTRRVFDAIPEMAGLDHERWFGSLYQLFSEPEIWRFYPGATDVLEELRERKYIVAVVSNWDRRLRRVAEGIGLTKRVDFLKISSEAGIRKPDRGIFLQALEEAGVSPGEACHVGDSWEEDVVGAHAAGIHPVWLDRAGRGSPSREPEHGRIGDLRELLALFP